MPNQIDYFDTPALALERDMTSGALSPILSGRAAIVTGGGKGIGRGISIRLAEAGARVVIVGHSNMQMAEETCDIIRSRGGEAVCIGVDLAQRESAGQVIQCALDHFGGIDILVNNAAFQPNLDIDEYPPDLFRTVINTNLIAYLRMTMGCFPYLKQSGHGRIVNIESVHAKRPTGFDFGYATSKGGLSQLTRETAVACIPYGMTCNAILPGGTMIEFKTVRPDLGVASYSPGRKVVRVERPRRFRLSHRVGKPADTANMTVFLCSDEAEHYNGVAIRADGGAMLV